MPRSEVVLYQEDETALVLKWLEGLPRKAQAKCLAYLQQLEEFGYELKRPIADSLRDGIHELRPSYQGVHYRLLYFFPNPEKSTAAEEARVVVVSHGLVKERAVPDAEIERAIERKRRFEANPERHTFNPARKR
jgi:phage-related protein